MRVVGIYLLYAAVALRGLVRFWDNPGRVSLVAVLLAYGLLLTLSLQVLAAEGPTETDRLRRQKIIVSAFLFLQTGLVMALFRLGTGADFFALLFIPLSLQATLFFGGQLGVLWILLFGICMLIGLRGVEAEPLFGAGMTVVYGGLCLLFGGYAIQVRKAEAARLENQRLLTELSAAHTELERYANQIEEFAAEHERSRLARELHDSVTQTAFSLNLAVQSAQLLLGREAGLLAAQLERVEQLAANAIGEIQNLVSELSAETTTPYDLASALQRLAREREQRDGLRVTVQARGDQQLLPYTAQQLYAIAQEALTNVVKHSGVCEATVRLSLVCGQMVLEIEDKGQGFSSYMPASGEGHMGLTGMRERAREIGWDFCVESHPGSGTRVRVRGNGMEGVV